MLDSSLPSAALAIRSPGEMHQTELDEDSEHDKLHRKHNTALEISLLANSPAHNFKFIPPNFFDHHVVAWRFCLPGFHEADRKSLDEALADHFKLNEDDVTTRQDKRAGKSAFQDIHMMSKKGKDSSHQLAKEVIFFVKNKTDQAEFIETLASFLQSNNRTVPASLHIYKPELPRIFMKADDDDLPENWIPPEQRKRRLLKFSHVHGAKVSQNLFHSYQDPSTGQQFFLYAVNKIMEASVTELKMPSAPTDDLNIDIFANDIGVHHSQPLEGITVQSQLPIEIVREIYPEISNSKLPKRVCSKLNHNKIDFDIHIADGSLMRLKLESRKSESSKEDILSNSNNGINENNQDDDNADDNGDDANSKKKKSSSSKKKGKGKSKKKKK